MHASVDNAPEMSTDQRRQLHQQLVMAVCDHRPCGAQLYALALSLASPSSRLPVNLRDACLFLPHLCAKWGIRSAMRRIFAPEGRARTPSQDRMPSPADNAPGTNGGNRMSGHYVISKRHDGWAIAVDGSMLLICERKKMAIQAVRDATRNASAAAGGSDRCCEAELEQERNNYPELLIAIAS
jgi:hypothetical protein